MRLNSDERRSGYEYDICACKSISSSLIDTPINMDISQTLKSAFQLG